MYITNILFEDTFKNVSIINYEFFFFLILFFLNDFICVLNIYVNMYDFTLYSTYYNLC